jgi:hypothetical protein
MANRDDTIKMSELRRIISDVFRDDPRFFITRQREKELLTALEQRRGSMT